MLGLVFFVMLIYRLLDKGILHLLYMNAKGKKNHFSVFGFYLFGAVDSNNFGSLHQSFISLFVLVTTAK